MSLFLVCSSPLFSSPEPRLVDIDTIQDCASRYAIPQWMLDLEISGDESDKSLIAGFHMTSVNFKLQKY